MGQLDVKRRDKQLLLLQVFSSTNRFLVIGDLDLAGFFTFPRTFLNFSEKTLRELFLGKFSRKSARRSCTSLIHLHLGSVRDAGGSMGKRQAAQEEQFFRQEQQRQIEEYKQKQKEAANAGNNKK